jgi:signal transduction histidine kinase
MYIILKIETATASLDRLIQLYQIEILRQELLLKVKKVQNNLILNSTGHSIDLPIIIDDVKKMDNAVNKCFECHHTEKVEGLLKDLKDEIGAYKLSISDIFTMRANLKRMKEEEENAYRLGEKIISAIDGMIIITGIKLEQRTKETLEDVSNIKKVLFSVMLIMPFGIIILTHILVIGLTGPINSLVIATRKLKEGNLDYRVKGLKYEFNELALSFNEMARFLKEQMQRMQQIEQLRVCGELAAGFAHEIRNPLAGIKLSMEILAEDPSMSAENKDILIKVIAEIKRIEILLRDLLSFAKPSKLNLQEIDINFVLENALIFSLKNPAFKSSTNPIKIEKYFRDIPKTMADPMQLQQVFMNLIINAVEEMPNGGTLSLSTFYNHQSETIDIEVSDTGKGIDEKNMASIFQPFFTTKTKGTGLGLAVTKSIVEQHNGTISVQNKPEGGAIFIVKIPLRKKEEENEG